MSVLKQLRGLTKRSFKYLTKDVYDVNSDKHLDEIIQELKNKGGGNKFLVNGKNYFDLNDISQVEYNLAIRFTTAEVIGGLISFYLNKGDVKLDITATSEETYDVYLILDSTIDYGAIFCSVGIEIDYELEEPRVLVGEVNTGIFNSDDIGGIFREVIEGFTVEDLETFQPE